MKKRYEPYSEMMDETPNPLDYLSDLVSFALADYYCQLSTHIKSPPLNSDESNGRKIILDVGGDIGIHAHILSKISKNKTVVLDIRNRIYAMDPLLLKEKFNSIIKDGARDYQDSWMRNIEPQDFKNIMLDLYRKIYSGDDSEEGDIYDYLSYSGENFYAVQKKAAVITSFSSLDYFSAPEFFAKCSSIQESGGLIYTWIPSFVFHFNPINLIYKRTLSAPATLSISEIIYKAILHFRGVDKIIRQLFWYQNGDGPMVLENYCDLLKENNYSILSQHRPSVALLDSNSKTYSINWYGRRACFSEKQITYSLKKAKKNSPTLAKYLVADDFFAPYYYILAKKN